MSLSIPTTSKPASTKCRTDSDPIRPPEPVMIATGIPLPSSEFQRFSHRSLVRLGPLEDVGEYLRRPPLRTPVSVPEEAAAVGDVHRHVTHLRLVRRPVHSDGAPRDLATESRELEQREAHGTAAADVERPPGPCLRRLQLVLQEVDQIVYVQ